MATNKYGFGQLKKSLNEFLSDDDEQFASRIAEMIDQRNADREKRELPKTDATFLLKWAEEKYETGEYN